MRKKPIPGFDRATPNQIFNTSKSFRKTVMNNSAVSAPLQNYIKKYNQVLTALKKSLDQKVAAGTITKEAADQKFAQLSQKALQYFQFHVANFEKQIQRSLAPKIQPMLDQTNLANPLNMQLALQNPDSIVSQNMDTQDAAIIESLNEEADKVNEAINQTAENVNLDNINQLEAPTPSPSHAKVIEAMEELSGTPNNEATEKTFFDRCGNALLEIGIAKESLDFAKGEEKSIETDSPFKMKPEMKPSIEKSK